MRALVLLLLLAASRASPAPPPDGRPGPAPGAPGVLERVRARGLVRCGGVPRPGLAQEAGGRFTGLEVDLCRAVAAAVLGDPDRVEFRGYGSERAFDGVREGRDDLSFLTGSEVSAHRLAGRVLPVATAFVETEAVMVPAASKARRLADLAGETVCFLIGSSAERSLEDALEPLARRWLRVPFSEEGEMNDAYAVRRCRAIAGELTTLAASSAEAGGGGANRLLAEPLEAFPVMAATGTADGRWAAVVAWTVHTVVSAERPETRWYAGGPRALPLDLAELGLAGDWQRRVVAAVGHYGQIFERNLGRSSRLGLERGLNANQRGAGLLLGPFLD